jgi:hypothetical protein
MLKVEDMSKAEMHELLERQSFGHLGCARDGRHIRRADEFCLTTGRILAFSRRRA